MKNPKIGIIALAKVNHQKDEIKEMLEGWKNIFSKEESVDTIIEPSVLFEEEKVVASAKNMEKDGADIIVFIVGTWIFSSHVISAVNDLHIPFVLYGLSDKIANGNLGASLQIRYVLQEMKKNFIYLCGPKMDRKNLAEIIKYLKAASTIHSLRNSKVATIGGKCMMMYQTQVNEFSWKKTFGIDFPQYDAVQVFAEMKQIPEAEADKVADEFEKKFDRIVWKIDQTGEYIGKDVLRSQAKMYLGFKRLKDMYGIDAFANKCMPEMASEIYGYKYGACIATSLLNEAGILTACEADVPAAVTMLILNHLTGLKVFFADIARLNKRENRLTFFNCGTAPLSLADRAQPVEIWPMPAATADEGVDVRYMKHGTDLQRGGCVRFEYPNDQPVTIMRVGGNDDTLRFHVATAITCPREVSKDEILGQRWPGYGLKFKGNIDEFLNNTVGHHYIMVRGNWVDELRYMAKIYGINFRYFDGID